jgi:hypothetical protein
MSEKKSGSKATKRHEKVYRRIVRVYEKLKEGPASVKELADKLEKDGAFVGTRAAIDKEIEFALSVLKEIGTVEEVGDNKYRIVGHKIILKDDALRNSLLQHSENLLSDFLAILGGISYFKLPDPSEIFSNEKYKYLLEHLKKGYPEVYSNMEEMIRIEEEIQDYQEELCERIRGYLLEYNIPIEVEKEVMSGGVYSVISSMFGGSEGIVDDRIRDVVKLCLVDNIDNLASASKEQKTEDMVRLLIEHRDGEVIFAWLRPDLIEAIDKALSLDSIHNIYEKLKEKERDYEERRKRYEEDMKRIVCTVFQDGLPLQGWCDICRDYLEDLSEKREEKPRRGA